MKNLKKVLCLLLAVIMVVGVVPTQSQAAKIKLSAKKVTIKWGSEATIYVLG